MSDNLPTQKTLRAQGLDFFLASLAPVFIIGMIGALVFFLVSVCYDGSFQIRLLWNLGLYTAAAVLVARIAIEQSRPRAIAYLSVLAASTMVMTPSVFALRGPMSALGFPILVALLGMIAYLADRITFDSAVMSERTESSGIGLLQSLGVVRSEPQQKRAIRLRRHNPGVWVLYFALMALPIFGLGQLFLKDPIDRRWGFIYLFAYMACSFCLLVMIALLSLRKYLRERGVPMDTAFAMRWLAIGFASVCVILGLLFWIPLPSQSILTMDLPFTITDRDDLRAHPWGWGEEGVNGDDAKVGKPQNQQPEERENGPQAKAVANDGGHAKTTEEQQQAPEKPNQGQAEQRQPVDPTNQNELEKAPVNKAGKVPQAQPPDRNAPKRNLEQDRVPEPQANEREETVPPPNAWPQLEWNLAAMLRWLIMILLAIAAVVFGILYRKEMMAAWSEYLRWLQGFFRGKRIGVVSPVDEETAAWVADPYPPFGTFANPFATGQNWTREQIVRHLYRACLSWGYEHRIMRRDEETPEEYMRRLAKRFPQQQESITLLGSLYNRIAYARGKVAADELPAMKNLWHWFVQTNAS